MRREKMVGNAPALPAPLPMTARLIACVLGGTAPGARTELHDVAFAIGESIDAVHGQLLDAWFGSPRGLHVDAWCFLDSIAGYRIRLAPQPPNNGLALYFVNIGGYQPGLFGEHHAWGFFAGASAAEVKQHAKATLLQDCRQIHKDNLHAVDTLLPAARVAGLHVHVHAEHAAPAPVIVNGYFPLPAPAIAAWQATRDTAAHAHHEIPA